MDWDYYATRRGYICGGSNHFVSHDDVEAMLANGLPPYIEVVNFSPQTREITPPPANDQRDVSGRIPAWTKPEFWERHRLLGTRLGRCGPSGTLREARSGPLL
jgi:hypothetical protein